MVIYQGGVISVGLHGSVKRYDKSGPIVLVEWNDQLSLNVLVLLHVTRKDSLFFHR